MNYDALLKMALIDYYNAEYERWERAIRDIPDHEFSSGHIVRMHKLTAVSGRKYITVGRRRLRRAFVIAAAIAMILASVAAVIAIVRPQIFFEIKEKATHWVIDFRQEGNEETNAGFECIKPEAPEGYSIQYENYIEGVLYEISFANAEGSEIYYNQSIADGSRAYLDSETGTITTETIEGHTVLLKEDEKKNAVFFEDGTYTYYIDGDCELDKLRPLINDILMRSSNSY